VSPARYDHVPEMNKLNKVIFWLFGPAIAVGLVSFAAIGNAGPGFFSWTLVSGIGFLLIAPLIQWALMTTSTFKERTGSACGLALGFVAICAILGFFSGAFNFW
jgi:hypothetical protein